MTSIVHEREKSLIAGCASGCQDRWRRFSVQYGRLIRKTATTACAQWGTPGQEVDDLAGYVYEKLVEDDYRRLRAWRQRSSFSTYLVQVTKNLCIDYLKRHHRFMDRHIMTGDSEPMEMPDGRDPVPDAMDQKELLQKLEEGVEALSPKQSLIVKLRLSGKSLREIARILDMPEGSVFGENARAMDRLKQVLNPDAVDDAGAPPRRDDA